MFCAWQNLLIHCYNQYQHHRNHTFHWKDECEKPNISCFNGRYESWQIYSKTRVYWNYLSQSIWKISTNVKKEFVKEEASSETTFEENDSNLKKKTLTDGGYQQSFRGTQRQFSENICSKDDLRCRIFGTFVVKFLACLPLLGFSNI